MSYDTIRYNIKELSNQSLSVIECGLQICHSGHSSPRMVYKDYSAHFILEGKGKYCVNGKTYELHSGQGFMITPDIPNIYIADEKEPWKYIYVSFKGVDAVTLVHNAGLNDKDVIFSFPLTKEVVNDLKCMHAAGNDYLSKGYDVLGYFLLVMSHLVRENNQKKHNILSTDNYVEIACSYMDDHMTYDISINDVANYVKIDRSYLYRLFIKHLGISPSKYLADARMKRALNLMEYDILSLNEVALSAGFYDLSHFSRMFIAKYGVSPGKYKASKKEKTI